MDVVVAGEMVALDKVVVVTLDPLALVAEKTKVSKRKEKVKVQIEFEGSDDDDISDQKKITALLAKTFNRKKYYAKLTNNNLRTSSANKKPEYVKSVEKKEDKKKAKVKDYNCYKTKMLLAKKDSDEQVLLAEDQAWIESSSDSDQEINANMVFMAKMEKVLSNSDESSSSAEETIAEEENNELKEQMNVLNEKNVDLLTQTEVLQDQFKVKHVVIDTHTECQAQYAKLKEERYEYMIRYSALYNNDKQHRKNIDEQEILFDKMSRQLVKMNNNVLRIQENILEKESKISELEGCGIGFEHPSYFEKAKDLRHSLYDEKVIGLGYTLMFLTHSDEALEIEKFKRARENKIKFAYDYGNLNASYVNEKINFSDDYFQEIINLDFEKTDSSFQQTSSLKPYVPTVILEKIIIDLEDEVVSLLEKEKANLELIESLKSKGFESSKNAISESENQSENDCHVVEKDLDTFSSVRRPKHSSVIWKKKCSSNTSNVDLSSVSHSKLNKNIKQYSREDLLSCNNALLGETSSAYNCNDAMNVFCNSRLCDSFDKNNLFVFDDIVQICLWIIDSGCSKHMMGNRALLTNFVEKFLGTIRFGNNNFTVIVGYGDVVIGSMKIKKVYYVEGL
nr:integrase, catalytic region, zinc finger, CCHC-type, peptidase aspartic, catalytic [Tanacetum cinerariifolium]